MRSIVNRSMDLGASLAGEIARLLWQDGGQRTARRNAWSAMVADSQRARAREDADASSSTRPSVPAVAAARS